MNQKLSHRSVLSIKDSNNVKQMENRQTSKSGPAMQFGGNWGGKWKEQLLTGEWKEQLLSSCSAAAHQLDKLIICSFVSFNIRYNHTFYLDLLLPYCCLNGTGERLGECCLFQHRVARPQIPKVSCHSFLWLCVVRCCSSRWRQWLLLLLACFDKLTGWLS